MQQGDDETSDEALIRLQKQMINMKKEFEDKSVSQQTEISEKKFWDDYDKGATSFINDQEDISDAGKNILNALLRNESFVKDVDMNKKSDIKKMNAQAVKIVKDLENNAIQDYIDGKKKLTKISSTDDTITTLKEKKINFKDMKQQAIEMLRKNHGFG